MQSKTIYAKLIHTSHHSNRYCFITGWWKVFFYSQYCLTGQQQGCCDLAAYFLSALVAQVSIPLTESWYGNAIRDSDGDISTKDGDLLWILQYVKLLPDAAAIRKLLFLSGIGRVKRSLTWKAFNTVPGAATVSIAFHYTPKFYTFDKRRKWCFAINQSWFRGV